MIALHLAALALATATQADLQQASPPEKASRAAVATAIRAAASPVIDGSNNDQIWAIAPKFSDFREFDPRQDADPRFKTEFQVSYDERNLFVFVRAYDPHPDSIMRALTRRDVRGPSDQLKVIIDSYNDRRSGFEFAVNPDGVKRDYAIYNDNAEDGSWNGVWDVATTIDSLGWTAEFRIPLSQLRYANADSHTFGIGVWRDIERFSERVSWPLYSTSTNGLASQLGQLEGITGIGAPGRLELTPYTVTRNISRANGSGFERDQQFAIGGDLKYGLGPNITLDATVNPDFGQVEADPAVLNLSAFETFVSERRPFFVEGTGFYRFALNCYIVVDCSTNEGLFYSRRIGRDPSLRQVYGDAATPTATPIAAAAKLTGRTQGGLSFGILDAVTQHVGGIESRTVEPRTNYAVIRAQQDLRGGEADISFIATAVNRSLDEWTGPVLHNSAYIAGASFRNRMGDYELAASVTGSRVAGTAEAIARTQLNPVHYYQQPDDDQEFDPTRTSLAGHSEQVKFGKYGGGVTRFETSFVNTSAGFEPNDLGYLRRADTRDWSTWAALNFRDPTSLYRWLQINANHWQTWTTSGRRLESAVNANAHMGLHNNWNFHAGATLGGLGESYCDRCTRGGPLLRDSRGLYPWFGVNGDSRRSIVPSMWVNLSFFDEGQSESVSLSPSVSLRFSSRLQTSISAGFSKSNNHTQWFGNFTEGSTTRYTFAHLNQRTTSMSVRIGYTATPDLTLEFYGEPFVSTGTYSQFREISANPGAAEYAERFQSFTLPEDVPTSFKSSSLRTNTVLRWEYRPGSTVFLVWAHGRGAFEQAVGATYTNGWQRDYGDLFDLRPDNTFLIKVAWWLSR